MCRQKGGRKLLARRIHQICSEKAQRRWSFQAAPLSWLYLSVLWVIIPCVLSWGNPRHHFWNEEASRSARCQGERGKSRPFRLEVGHAVSLWCCNCFSILDKRFGTGVLEEENLQNALLITEDVLKMWRQVVVHCKGNGTKNRQRRWQQVFSKDRLVHSPKKKKKIGQRVDSSLKIQRPIGAEKSKVSFLPCVCLSSDWLWLIFHHRLNQ